jgi:hypothetical protein
VLIATTIIALAIAAEPGACVTCHREMKREHVDLTNAHKDVACDACHLADPGQTHEAPHPDVLVRKHTQAGCASCHVVGAVKGTEAIARGALLYNELGCQLCHRGAVGYGYPGAFGLPLNAIGHRGSKYLKTMLHDPTSVFKATVMPSFDRVLSRDRAMEDALLAYLLSLRGTEPPAKARHTASAPCVSCHAGAKPIDMIKSHRCAFISENKEDLRCARCHAKGVPKTKNECLYIQQRRLDCGVCHSGDIDAY